MPILRSARATSAGGVVHRVHDGHVEVVLVHRRSPRLWALPKGTPDSGETIEETALRETREETGLEVEIVAPLHSIRYFFVRGSTRFHKTVHFFLMRAVGGSPDAHDAEFDEVRWATASEALALLTHATERSVVERALTLLEGTASREATA
ncbi:MAG TPA: NUDIX hydrolase [Candidatus Limnocylindria bacterium]|nr:NUDIX hydrolase [Candidatus Limnocylindria bacterium]